MNPDTTPTPRTDAIQRITDYMLSGGLFNPELAIHENVRDLLSDCKTELTEKTNEVARLRAEVQRAIENRNRIGIEIRGEYLLKLKDQTKEVARLRELLEKALFELEKVPFQTPKLTAFTAHRLADRYRDQLNQITK